MLVPDPLYVSPIGGCGEFGKNLTLYRYRNSLYVVDCGIRFAEMWQLGISGWIADYQQLFSTYGAPTAYLLTHGHEDHIGAMPFFYAKWPAPIYASAWTMELIKLKFEKHNLKFQQPPVVIESNETSEFEDGFAVDWIQVNHSIPMTYALLLRTPHHRVFHSGDFKFDPTPLYEEETDFQALCNLRPIDLLLVDSTNVHLAGPSPSERKVRPTLQSYLSKDCSAVYLTTFASNVWRIKQVIEIAQSINKPVYAISRAIEASIIIGMKLGIFNPDQCPVQFLAKNRTVADGSIILVSGCQGERLSSLSRLAQGHLRGCKLNKGDIVIFSSRPIPGNELEIIKVCERVKEAGAHVITVSEDPDIHVSGHAHSQDIAKLIECLAPREIMPVHGNYSHLDEVQRLAATKIPSHVPTNGDLYELGGGGLKKISNHQFNSLFIDGDSLVPLSFKTMRDRMRLSEFGLCQVVGVINKHNRKWLSQPQVHQLLGLCEDDQQPSLCGRVNKALAEEVASTDMSKLGHDDLKEKVRIMFRRRLNSLIGKRAVVTCNIIEV